MKRKIFSKLLMGAFLIASVSMFVSCKDYDDDIQKNSQEIEALKAKLNSEISNAKSDFATQLSTVTSQITALQSDIDAKIAKLATAADVKSATDALQKDIDELKGLTQRVAVLETQIAAIDALKSDVAAKANQSDYETLAKQVGDLAALTGSFALAKDIPTEAQIKAYAEATVKSLAVQQDAFDAYKKQVEGDLAKYATKDEIKNFITKADLAGLVTTEELKESLKGLDIEALNSSIKKLNELIDDSYKAKLDELIKNAQTKSDVDAAIKELSDEVAKKFEELGKSIDAEVGANLRALEAFVAKRVTSVVLKPDFYWEGLEAIETAYLKTPEFKENGAYDFKYIINGWTQGDNEVKVHVDNIMSWLCTDGTKLSSESNKTWDAHMTQRKPSGTSSTAITYYSLIEADGVAYANNQKKTLQYVTIAPNAIAKYHINPATADLKDAKYSFYQNTAEVYTRADASIDATPVDGVKFENGILTVPFKVKYDQVWAYFSKWAFDNDTWTAWQNNAGANWGYEPGNVWDNAHNNGGYTYINWQTGQAVDANGNPIDVVTAINQYWSGNGTPSAYGTSDYYKADGSFDKQDVAKLPFISLSVTTNDTLVTSDYGVVVPATYTIVALADKAPNKVLDKGTFVGDHDNTFNYIRRNHLYESVGVEGTYDYNGTGYSWYNGPGAIPSPATHDVAYRDTIDLLPFIETHYSYTTYTRYGQSTVDKVMSDDLMKKLGLHYEFKEIHYITGKNITSESAHIKHVGDAKSGKFTPCSIELDENNEWIKGSQIVPAGREVIDREPLVRVDLVTEDGKIVRYGYIKLRITENKESLEDVNVEVDLSDYYMNCGDQMRMTWYQFEKLILAKLNGGKGLTKQEFEDKYYFMNEGGWGSMPQNYNGALYGTADANQFWGTRWYRDANGKIVEAASANNENDAVNTFDYKKWTADNNWFGRVWYTPHDNPTGTHDWDEQTNVLIWDLHGYNEAFEYNADGTVKSTYRGNMKDLYTANLFERLIKVADATFERKGLSQKTISTIVRFKSKTDDIYVNVKLNIPVGKLHFEWGAVNNKDWAHWYKFNSPTPGTLDNAKPYWNEFDAHINPFKPSNNGYNFLDVYSYTQLLTDNWLDPTKMVVLEETDKFGKFQSPNAPVVSFLFTTPTKDVNSKRVSANNNGEWDVLGASGTKWTLKVGAHNGIDNTAIFAVKKNGKNYGPEEVCYLDDQLTKVIGTVNTVIANNNRIHYHGLEAAGAANLYPAATDLVNKVGAYEADGDPRFTLGEGLNNMKTAEYLDDNVDKTFTAYLELKVAHNLCYNPLIGKRLFNIRVHRPINVAGKEYEWNDRVLNDNRLAIKDLVEIVDWNRFPVVPAGNSEIQHQHTIFDITQPAYASVYASAGKMKAQNIGIPYEYYGIQELAVRYDEIRTDHAKQPDVRANKYYDPALIKQNTDLVKDLNSLTSWRETNLKTLSLINADGTTVPFDVAHAYNKSNYNAAAPGNTTFGWLYYNNNASNVQLFHIYVPIAVKYNWGNIAYDYVFGENVAKPAKLDNDYTQTVWAIITVKGTH